MILFKCDICGRKIKQKEIRYELKIELKAAYDKLEITLFDLMRDHQKEYEKLIRKIKEEKLDAEKLQEDIYKRFDFHLCRDCQQRYIRKPLPEGAFNIHERFRRRLDQDDD